MATSGYLDKKVTDYDTLRFSWERTAYSADTNKSTIKWTLSLIAGAYGAISSSATKYYGVTVNGTTYSGSNYIAIGNNATKVLATGNTQIAHNADGTKTFSFSFSQDFKITFNDVYIDTIRGSGTGVISPIPKPATLLSATSFTDNENPTITYSNPMGTSVGGLQACISWTGSDDIAYRNVPVDDTSYTFPLTSAEKTKLINAVTSGSTLSVKFYLKTTYTGGEGPSYSTLVRTFTLTGAYPTITSFTAKDVNSATLAVTGSEKTWVKNRSSIQYSISATSRADAPIEDYDIVCGDDVKYTASGTFTNATGKAVTATVVNSRGNASAATVSATTFIEYEPVGCILRDTKFTVAGEVGTISFNIKGYYYNGSFGAANNTLSVKYRYKVEGGTYTSWTTVSPTINEQQYSCAVSIPNLNYQQNYYIQAQAVDKLSTTPSAEHKVDKVVPIFDWSADDFSFNVPVVIEGNALNDFVIETGTEAMGTNGTWYWRKWKSGRAECYGCRNYGTMAVTTAWGNLYRSATFTQSLPSGLFTAVPEVIDISYRGGSGSGGWIANHENSAPSASVTGSFILVRPASATLSSSYLSFNIIGRWK